MQTLQKVADEIAPLARHFVEAGFKIYLVGGAVRDLVLENREAVDFDLTTDARPKQTKRLVKPLSEALWTQGERFGTIGCIIDGRDYEITTHRAEFYASTSRKPEVRFSTDVEADLSRRDFTVNAMAISLPDLELVDPFDGRSDLDAGILRTPLSAQISFTDDPLRMLRAARFMAGYHLDPVPELVDAMAEFASRISIVSAERIRDEILKLLDLNDPTPGLKLLADTGVLQHVLPNVVEHEDWQAALSASVRARRPVVRLAVLLAHESSDAAASAMRAMRATNDEVSLVRRLVGLQPSLAMTEWSPQGVRGLCAKSGDDLDAIMEFWAALGSEDSELLLSRDQFVVMRDALLGNEDLTDFNPPLDGQQIMELLSLSPGRQVGEALDMLTQHHIADGPLTVEAAESLLGEWYLSLASDE